MRPQRVAFQNEAVCELCGHIVSSNLASEMPTEFKNIKMDITDFALTCGKSASMLRVTGSMTKEIGNDDNVHPVWQVLWSGGPVRKNKDRFRSA